MVRWLWRRFMRWICARQGHIWRTMYALDGASVYRTCDRCKRLENRRSFLRKP